LTATNMTEASTQFPILTIKFDCSSASSALAIAKYCSLASAKTRRLVSQQIQATVQSQLAKDAQFKTQSPLYLDRIAHCYDHNKQIKATTNPTLTGKVRDTHFGATTLALVTTDRQSGFDRQLAVVPFKGAVLNLTAAFWCEATKDIIANHLISVPHPNVSIVKQCTPFPIEFVVRSYLTGSTDTSIWKHYQAGVRTYCEHALPDGMVKNQPLPTTILTPTTKEEHHDRPIGPTAIVSEGWMTQEDLDVCHKAALAIFARGQQVASSHGLILVDTKYEFGKDKVTGEILLIDEVHTPDSSRYWLASTYQERQAAGLEPENIDKEFLRLWFRDHCDPYADAEIPDAPRDLVLELARRYITLYEMITWKDFDFDAVTNQDDIAAVIEKHLK
jgi:phosphoribosylaminoimidazole-succinocarboxamide synthase